MPSRAKTAADAFLQEKLICVPPRFPVEIPPHTYFERREARVLQRTTNANEGRRRKEELRNGPAFFPQVHPSSFILHPFPAAGLLPVVVRMGDENPCASVLWAEGPATGQQRPGSRAETTRNPSGAAQFIRYRRRRRCPTPPVEPPFQGLGCFARRRTQGVALGWLGAGPLALNHRRRRPRAVVGRGS